MGMTQKEKKRAWTLRKNENRSEDENRELETLEAKRGKPGRKKKSENEPTMHESEPSSPILSETVGAMNSGESSTKTQSEPQAEQASPKKPRTPIAPPPHIKLKAGKDDWRLQYQSKVGREADCVELAQLWCIGLMKGIDYIEANGGKSLFTKEMIEKDIFPAAVLTVDKLLPQGFNTGPEVKVAVGSTIVIAQAAVTASKVKKQKRGEQNGASKRVDDLQEPPTVVFEQAPEATPRINMSELKVF